MPVRRGANGSLWCTRAETTCFSWVPGMHCRMWRLEFDKNFPGSPAIIPSFSLSGGMVITGGNFPVYKSAEMAGEAEANAKSHTTVITRTRKKRQKNAFTFFDHPMHWQQFSALADMQQKLVAIVSQKEHYPLLQRLKAIARSFQESAREVTRSAKRKSHWRRSATGCRRKKWRWANGIHLVPLLRQ